MANAKKSIPKGQFDCGYWKFTRNRATKAILRRSYKKHNRRVIEKVKSGVEQ